MRVGAIVVRGDACGLHTLPWCQLEVARLFPRKRPLLRPDLVVRCSRCCCGIPADGSVGWVRCDRGSPVAEIGWDILPAFWRRGYALEAAIASASFACDRLGWVAIGHVIDPQNRASIALAQALGSRHRGPVSLP